MEHSADQPTDPPRDEELGEDHRDGPPGYDLDEQQAIEDLQDEEQQGE